MKTKLYLIAGRDVKKSTKNLLVLRKLHFLVMDVREFI